MEKVLAIVGVLLGTLCVGGFWALRARTVIKQQCLNNMR